MHISPATNLLAGAAGGAMIAVSSSALLYLKGRISGMSGILAQTLQTKLSCPSSWWRVAYVSGLVLAGIVFGHATERDDALALKPAALVAAGLLVGFGTRLSGGCTSGHGVMGLPRLSPRSMVAVPTFMAAASIAATLSRSYDMSKLALAIWEPSAAVSAGSSALQAAPLAVLAAVLLMRALWSSKNVELPSVKDVAHAVPGIVGAFGCAFLFGAGLAVSGMTNTAHVRGFLDFTSPQGWDLTLAAVMGSAVTVNFITFRYVHAPPVSALRALLSYPVLRYYYPSISHANHTLQPNARLHARPATGPLNANGQSHRARP